MPVTAPSQRKTRTLTRRTRAMLLPMQPALADELALKVHLALAVMRRGAGSMADAQTLTQALLLTGFIADSGYGAAIYEQLAPADAAISAAFDRGRDTGKWQLDDDAARLFAVIVTTYDAQLRRTPLWAIAEASGRLDGFQAGSAHRPANRTYA